MSATRFSCKTPSGGDLCFNGGVCVIAGDGIQSCACPAGWGPDNVIFKNPNCALPDHAILGLFVASIISAVIYLILFFRVRDKAKGQAKRILHLATFAVVSFAGEMLALYLENGWFTATSVMVCLVVVAFCWWGSEVSDIVASPIFSINRNIQMKVSKLLRFAFIFVTFLNVTTCTGLAVTARISDAAFNTAMYVYGMCQFVTVLGFAITMVHYGRALRLAVKQHNLEDELLVDKKVKSIEMGALSFVLGQIPGVIGCILMWTIGSTPFHWVIVFIIFFTTPISVVQATLAIFKTKSSSRSSKRFDSKSDQNSLTPRASGRADGYAASTATTVVYAGDSTLPSNAQSSS